MTKLIMMIGLPASGKSTIAKNISKSIEANIHSSDELRLEMYGSYNVFDKNSELFNKLHKRILNDLGNSINVIYDATNLSLKKRRAFLATVPNNVFIEAIVVATDIHKCLMRDSNRKKIVGKNVILKMWENFQFPLETEGFDNIEIKYTHDFEYRENLKNWNKCAHNFNQDNPHHSLNLYEHMLKAMANYGSNNSSCSEYYDTFKVEIYMALVIHDIGKLWTKTFKNKKGIVTDVAHYYNHQNVSAYQSMFLFDRDEKKSYNLNYILQLINYHMQPYSISTEKSKKKWLAIFGETLYKDLIEMNKYDQIGH